MAITKFLDGNSAVAYGVCAVQAQVIAAYPITPQTKIVEKISELISDGELVADYIKVESEHSAMSVCFGAASTGVRTFTATSSQGLAYMDEMLHYVSGARLPVVMAVSNRSLGPPWNIWCDHQDSISRRDSGWIQCYAESAQEALDLILQAYRIAENPDVLTPVMVCLDAFVVSHTNESVLLMEKEKVAKFLPTLKLKGVLDVNNPLTMSAGASPDYYTEFRYYQHKAMEEALKVIKETNDDFNTIFGRNYDGMIEKYGCEDTSAVLVVMGSLAGTVKDVVDEMREEGISVGMVRVRFLRPFPREEIRKVLENSRAIGVIDRNISYGFEGVLFSELKAALYTCECHSKITNFIGGLGGRDITKEDIRKMYLELMGESNELPPVKFVGLRCCR